jgi:Transposase DDE domain
MIEAAPEASIDATGLDDHYVSNHFVIRRKKFRPFVWRPWPKLSMVCHSSSHLWAGATLTEGPSGDASQFAPCLRQACRHLPIDRLLADAAFDGEHLHRLAREELGIRSTVIPLNRRNTGRRWPKTKYRRQMKRRFPTRQYGHRWQVESSISQHKRRLGPALRSRTDSARESEVHLRVLTHDLMILRCES